MWGQIGMFVHDDGVEYGRFRPTLWCSGDVMLMCLPEAVVRVLLLPHNGVRC